MGLSVVILAAGNGKRMNSTLPKVLHPLGNKPLLSHVITTAKTLAPQDIYVIYRHEKNIKETINESRIKWVEQTEPLGTGHAVAQALPFIPNDHQILVLYGDVPLIQTQTLQNLLHTASNDQLGVLVANLKDPYGFGRIIRNDAGDIITIVEQKDADETQLKIDEINTGIITSSAANFKKWLPNLNKANSQGEYYLTDVVSMATKDKVKICSVTALCHEEVSGVNDKAELVRLERYYQVQTALALLKQGVTIIDPARFDCRGTLSAKEDVFIDINVIFEGNVSIGEGSKIGAHSLLNNVIVGKDVTIHPHCVIQDAVIGDNCVIGPFARLRPSTKLGQHVHVGNFVELKNANLEAGSKANHLSYLGDVKIGEKANIGAGTITCNYNGTHKFETLIGDGAFIGSGTQLIAPVKIGDNAYVGAGSTISKDAPAGELTLARAKQVTIKNWKKK